MSNAVRFSKVNQPVACRGCGKTTNAGSNGLDLCAKCFDEAGLENEHQDGMHDGESAEGCPFCAKTAKPSPAVASEVPVSS
jgi:hypothetical protein